MYFFKHKIVCFIVSILVSLSLVVYSYGFYSVQAAEVSTLPAAIDITVSYDSDNVYWFYDGRDYIFSRSYPLTYEVDGATMYFAGISYDSTFGRYFRLYDYHTSDFNARTVEAPLGIRYNVSYWFSPGENCLYIHCTNGSGSEILDNKGFILSYFTGTDGQGSFSYHRSGSTQWPKTYIFRYDLNTGAMLIGGCHSYGGMTSYFYYNWEDKLSLSSSTADYDLYSCSSGVATGYLPSDLLCLYATYAINGFYEPDTSKVNTPDYYMQYQYIFYRDGKGYTFIDSAERLTEVTAQGSYVYLTFNDNCNKYVYTSVDGLDWSMRTTLTTMYGGTFTQLAYDWFYDKVTVGSVNEYNSELVYTNDDTFGVSIKAWNSLYDVIEDLPELHGSDYSDDRFEKLIGEDALITNPWGDIKGLTEFFVGIFTRDEYIAGMGLKDLSSSLDEEVVKTYFATTSDQILIQSLLGDKVTQIVDNQGVYSMVSVDSIRSLIKGIHSLTQDTNTLLSMLHNDFVGVNDNLSLLYDVDNNLLAAVKGIKVPAPIDYSSTFEQLSKDMNAGFWLNISEISGFRSMFNGVPDSLVDIRKAIENIDFSVDFPEAEPKNDLFYDNPDSDEDLIDFVSEYAKTALDKSYFASFLTFDNDTMSGIRFYNGLSEEAFKTLGPLGAVLLVPVGFMLVGTAVRRHT